MVEPGAVRVEFDVRRWWWTLAVNQVKRIATEGIGCMEDAAWIVGFPLGDSVDMVLPSLVSVEGLWLAYVEHYGKILYMSRCFTFYFLLLLFDLFVLFRQAPE